MPPAPAPAAARSGSEEPPGHLPPRPGGLPDPVEEPHDREAACVSTSGAQRGGEHGGFRGPPGRAVGGGASAWRRRNEPRHAPQHPDPPRALTRSCMAVLRPGSVSRTGGCRWHGMEVVVEVDRWQAELESVCVRVARWFTRTTRSGRAPVHREPHPENPDVRPCPPPGSLSRTRPLRWPTGGRSRCARGATPRDFAPVPAPALGTREHGDAEDREDHRSCGGTPEPEERRKRPPLRQPFRAPGDHRRCQ